MAAAGGGYLLPIVAAIIGIGVIAQILADRFQVPSVVFLIAAGVLLGPEMLGVVGPDSFGNALGAIVGLSVAIIVFEGAFHFMIDNPDHVEHVVDHHASFGVTAILTTLGNLLLIVAAWFPVRARQ